MPRIDNRFKASQVQRARAMYANALEKPNSLLLAIRGACAMGCTMCYVTNRSNKTLPVDVVDTWLSSNPQVKTVSVYGGDICDDYRYAENLFSTLHKHRVVIRATTGALNMNEAFVDLFNRYNVKLQLSLEPVQWGKRIDHTGKHIMDRLSSNLLHKLTNPYNVNTALHLEEMDGSYSDYIDSLANLRGCYDFTCTFNPVASENAQLPSYIDRWERESMDTLDYPCYMHKWLFRTPWLHFKGSAGEACGATNFVTLGPDGKEYSCHEKAVNLDGTWLRGDQHLKHVWEWSRQMINFDCIKCPAQLKCGGICYNHKVGNTNSTCQFWVRAIKQYPKFEEYMGYRNDAELDTTDSDLFDTWINSTTFESAYEIIK
jgi:radical SAM protein with 4Fe4S-binding SPASM domain